MSADEAISGLPHHVVFDATHEVTAVQRLLQFQEKKQRIVAFIRAISRATQCAEEELYPVITASLIDNSTPLDLLRRWAAIMGVRDATALTRTQLLQIVRNRITANTIGTTENKATFQSYIDLLKCVFADSGLQIDMFPGGSPLISVTVLSADGLLPEALALRAGQVAAVGRPIGTLVTIFEVTSESKQFDNASRGFDGPLFGREVFNGFG